MANCAPPPPPACDADAAGDGGDGGGGAVSGGGDLGASVLVSTLDTMVRLEPLLFMVVLPSPWGEIMSSSVPPRYVMKSFLP